MADIYRQRFTELGQQMEALLASKKPVFSDFLQRSEVTIDSNGLLEWKVKARSLLNKACGTDSEHYKEFLENENTGLYSSNLSTLERLKAIFLAAKEDYEGGYLRTQRSLIQAELFDSELEQAKALLAAGFKAPAAVVAGAVLETSLRELCDRSTIAHSKLDKMNADLAKAGIYNVSLQKKITALAAIRNSAAHGNHAEFSDRDVDDLIRDVERFVAEQL